MIKRSLLFLLIILIFGCAKTQWSKPGATSQDFYRNKLECQQRARQAQKETQRTLYFPDDGFGPMGESAILSSVYTRTFESCMMAKGWRKERV